MSFNSLEYVVFVLIAFVLYWAFARMPKAQNIILAIAGLAFIGWVDWRMAVPVIVLGALTYIAAILLEKPSLNRLIKRIIIWSITSVCIGALAYYKYCNFFINSFASVLHAFGLHARFHTLNIILPLGISFYTFQTLGYVIDVYGGRYKATRDIVAYMAFVLFFPKLLAGPIERALNLLDQLILPRQFDYGLAVDGCRQILWGLFKKLVIADNCGYLVNNVFNGSTPPAGVAVAVGALVYTIQIYCDFSGYSDIAIGSGKLFGIRCMVNFRFPYFAHNISDFWRRWHISLTTWFRDYLYIPLGGSRTSTGKHIRNIFIVFIASGLWHGANWTFVVWGLYHAMLFMPLLLTAKLRANKPLLPKGLGWVMTFVFVALGWTVFIAPDIATWLTWMDSLIFIRGSKSLYGLCIRSVPWLFIAIGIAFEFINRKREYGLAVLPNSRVVRWLIYVSLCMTVVFFRGNAGSFIYAQF